MSIEQLKSKAKKALLDGKYKKALEFYETLHKDDVKDRRLHAKLAELREKTGDTAGAVKDYVMIAKAYADEGFVVQAIAINKIILRLDPERTEIQDRLKDLSTERGDDWAISTISPQDNMQPLDLSNKAKLSVERTPLLSGLSGDEFEEFMDSLELKDIAAGSVIYHQGEKDEYLYLIGMGAVRLEIDVANGARRMFSRLMEGDFCGEHAFMSRTVHNETAVAESDVSLLMIDRRTFDAWVEKYPGIQSTVEDFYTKRVLARVLAITPIFGGVTADARFALADKFHLRHFNPGEVIVKEGDSGFTFYLIRSGQVSVSVVDRKHAGQSVQLGRMGEGAFFGEVSLLTDKPRTATVIAMTDVELMELSREDFDDIVKSHPSVLKVVEAYQKQRVQNTIKTLMQQKD